MEATVNKLSPEEQPLLENILTLIQQLLAMQNTGTEQMEPTVEEAEMEPQEETVDVGKSEGETGDSKAEERLDEQTNTTDHSLSDLGKAINELKNVIGQKKVQKAQPKPASKELVLIAQALAQVVKSQQEQQTLNKQLFEAIGITDEVIQKNLQPEQVKKDKPIQNTDTASIVKDILTEVFKQVPAMNQNPEYRHPFNQKKTEARKNMSGLLNYIHNSPR